MTGPDAPRPALAAADAAVDAWVAAWNQADAAARAAHLARAVVEDCVFVGPTGTVTGRAALLATIAEARDLMPGAQVVRAGAAWEADGGGWRFAWEVRAADGTPVLAGEDAVDLDPAGRMRRVVVLPGTSG